MIKDTSITQWFGENLAQLLADKILEVYQDFDTPRYIKTIEKECADLGYTKRVELHADVLKDQKIHREVWFR